MKGRAGLRAATFPADQVGYFFFAFLICFRVRSFSWNLQVILLLLPFRLLCNSMLYR